MDNQAGAKDRRAGPSRARPAASRRPTAPSLALVKPFLHLCCYQKACISSVKHMVEVSFCLHVTSIDKHSWCQCNASLAVVKLSATNCMLHCMTIIFWRRKTGCFWLQGFQQDTIVLFPLPQDFLLPRGRNNVNILLCLEFSCQDNCIASLQRP